MVRIIYILILIHSVCFGQNEQNFKPSGGSGGSGDINQNGNSFGTTFQIGSNDNHPVSLETNGTEKFKIASNASLGGEINQYIYSNLTTTPTDAYKFQSSTSGTAAIGFGTRQIFCGHSNNGTMRDIGTLDFSWRIATDAIRSGQMYLRFPESGGALTEYFRFTGENNGTFVIGDGNRLTITRSQFSPVNAFSFSSSSTFSISSSANSATAILLNGNNSSTPCVKLGNTNYSSTSGTKQMLLTNNNFTPASGTGLLTGFEFGWTINQTGGANGITRGLYINPTLTAAADFRAVDISNNSGHGIYQNGASAHNKFVGNTNIGSTANAVTKLQVTAGRFAQAQGANVAATGTLTLGSDGNAFNITSGASSINNIISTNWPAGSVIYLIIKASISFMHNNTSGGGTPILLAGSIGFAAVNNTVLTLLYDGSVWQEVSRKQP